MRDGSDRAALRERRWLPAAHRDTPRPQRVRWAHGEHRSPSRRAPASWPGGISRPRSPQRVSPAKTSRRRLRWVWCHHSQSDNSEIRRGERDNSLSGGKGHLCVRVQFPFTDPDPKMLPPGRRPGEQRGQNPMRRCWSPRLSPALGKPLSPLLPLIRGWVSPPAALGAVGFQREVGKRSQPDPPLLGSVISNGKILPGPKLLSLNPAGFAGAIGWQSSPARRPLPALPGRARPPTPIP